jgi:hypothetical protein
VGTSNLITVIRSELLQFSTGSSAPHLLLLRGDWGFGKSHLRALCEHEVERIGLPYVCGCVDGRDHSLAHLNRCLPTWLNSIQVGTFRGLPSAVTYDHFDRHKMFLWCAASIAPFARGISWALAGWPAGWLLATGEWYSAPDYSYQHRKSVELLKAAADFLHDVTGRGIVLLLDEVENITREWDIRGRKKCYDVLFQFAMNANLFVVLFVTERFFHQVTEDEERARSEGWATGTAAGFFRLVRSAVVLEPPVLDMSLARALLRKITDTYVTAYGAGKLDVSGVLASWQLTTTHSPRLLIRQAIHELDLSVAALSGV